jgi:hypothetical protein
MEVIMDSFDSISFESVSIADAHIVLEHPQYCYTESATDSVMPAISNKKMTPTQQPEELNGKALLWILKLPETCRPIKLSQEFPRIVNTIAMLWNQPLRCDDYLLSLLIDLRGNRQGFPPEVTEELFKLKTYYEAHHIHIHLTMWGDRIGGNMI